MQDGRCAGTVRGFVGDCERRPTVERNGKWYCWQHDPDRLAEQAKERRDAWRAKMQKEDDAFAARRSRRDLEARAGIKDLTDAELEKLAALGGVRNLLRAREAKAE